MTTASRSRIFSSVLLGTILTGGIAIAEDVDPVREVLNDVPTDVRVFNEHVTVLASPWMGGRLPGTPGMEMAKDYTEYWFEAGGLEPAIMNSENDNGSFRQPFPLGSSTEFKDQKLVVNTKDGQMSFDLGTDFEFTGLGDSGDVNGEVVFVGYSIENGPDDYESFEEDTDLEGKIAVMFRFEPMDENGDSKWREGRWSNKAGFSHKFRTINKRNPAAVILVNPPEANDPRTGTLMRSSSSMIKDIPVFMMSTEAADRMVKSMDPQGRNLMELRTLADNGTALVDFEGTIEAKGTIEQTPQIAENVIGIVPGRGKLKDEYIIIGGHLDHLGFGEFGSRRGGGNLHPGADDNASGSVAVIMLGESLKKAYDDAPEIEDLRTIVLAAFTAEESGLNGSRYYAQNPIFPLEDTSLMINFDMIGRIENKRLSISGSNTGVGMEEWAQPFYDNSGLEIVKAGMRGGGSDHASFYREGVPVLFGIIADFHDDYHTPDDTIDKLNRTDAVNTIRLFHELAFDAAKRPEKFAFMSERDSADDNSRSGPARPRALRVRLGIRSKAMDDGSGLEVVSVTEGSTADVGGIKSGDVIKKWDKQPMKSRADLVALLSELKPDDEVQAVIERDGETIVVFLKMKAPG